MEYSSYLLINLFNFILLLIYLILLLFFKNIFIILKLISTDVNKILAYMYSNNKYILSYNDNINQVTLVPH